MNLNSRLPIMMTESLRTSLWRGALLLVALGLVPSASFAHSAACGSANNVDAPLVTAAAWTALRSCTLNLNDGEHSCVMTACADIDNPGGVNAQNRYRFTIAVDGAPAGTDTAYERTAVLTNNAGIKNPDSTSVCTVEQLDLAAGTHTFLFWGRKWQAATTNGTVTDSSLGVVCVDADPNANPNDDANDGSNGDSSVDLQ